MEQLKNRLDKKTKLFEEKVNKEFEEFMKYFKEVIELKEQFFDTEITIYKKYTKKVKIGVGIRFRELLIEKNTLFITTWTELSKITKGIEFFQDNEFIGIEHCIAWGYLKYLKDTLNIKSLLEDYITKNVEKKIEKIDKFLGVEKEENNCVNCGSKMQDNAIFCAKCGHKMIDEIKEIMKPNCGDDPNPIIRTYHHGDVFHVTCPKCECGISYIYETLNVTKDLNKIVKFMCSACNLIFYKSVINQIIYNKPIGKRPDLVIIDDREDLNQNIKSNREFIKNTSEIQETPWFEYWKEKFPNNTYYNKTNWIELGREKENCLMCSFYGTKLCEICDGEETYDVYPCNDFKKGYNTPKDIKEKIENGR